MRKIIFILLLLCSRLYSQDLTGNWQATSYEDKTLYYNKTKDSVSFKDYPNLDTNQAKEIAKGFLLKKFAFNFEKNGKATLSMQGNKLIGKYTNENREGKIIFEDRAYKEEVHYRLQNGILFVKFRKEDGFFEIGFKKS